MVEKTRQKIPVAIVRIPIFFLMLILDVHLMALGDGMIICGKRSAFYSQTACCLIDSSSAWMNMRVLDMHIGCIINQTVMHCCTQRGGCRSFT